MWKVIHRREVIKLSKVEQLKHLLEECNYLIANVSINSGNHTIKLQHKGGCPPPYKEQLFFEFEKEDNECIAYFYEKYTGQ